MGRMTRQRMRGTEEFRRNASREENRPGFASGVLQLHRVYLAVRDCLPHSRSRGGCRSAVVAVRRRHLSRVGVVRPLRDPRGYPEPSRPNRLLGREVQVDLLR